MLTQAPDGGFEAFPVKVNSNLIHSNIEFWLIFNWFQEWYNLQTVQSYNSLSYEEAEKEFTSRNKTFNLFNVIVRKKREKVKKKKKKNSGKDGNSPKMKNKAQVINNYFTLLTFFVFFIHSIKIFSYFSGSSSDSHGGSSASEMDKTKPNPKPKP